MTSQYLRSRFSSLREYLTPINHQSNFETTGEISPEEFVKAGDYLVYRFPTWQWSPADPSKTKDFLPREKQFLVTRHVPSYVRASDYEELPAEDVNMGDIETVEGEDSEGWTKTNTKPVLSRANSQLDESSIKEISSDDEADLQDIDELIDENAEDIDFLDNKKTLEGEETTCQITNKRNYDLYITYSTSYRVPKMYLVGFDNDSVPLTPEQMFEDIASDYRFKTVTIEKAPFLSNTTSVSIHPCKHANVMKVLMKHAKMAAIERLNKEKSDRVLKKISKLGLNEEDNDNKGLEEEWEDVQTNEENDKEESETEGIRVDQYLVVFLKFISSVTPGIEHDYTMEAL